MPGVKRLIPRWDFEGYEEVHFPRPDEEEIDLYVGYSSLNLFSMPYQDGNVIIINEHTKGQACILQLKDKKALLFEFYCFGGHQKYHCFKSLLETVNTMVNIHNAKH